MRGGLRIESVAVRRRVALGREAHRRDHAGAALEGVVDAAAREGRERGLALLQGLGDLELRADLEVLRKFRDGELDTLSEPWVNEE